MTDPLDIERALADIAAVAPGDSTRAIAHVRAALEKSRQSIRWLWPLSIAAAAALVVTAFMIFAFQPRASAADNLATTLAANQGYKGWVHMTESDLDDRSGSTVTPPDNEKVTRHWNTQTGATAAKDESPGETIITFSDPKSAHAQEYRSSTGWLRIYDLPATQMAEVRAEAAETPLNFSDMLARLRKVLGDKAVTIRQSTDNGMDRFDIQVDQSALKRLSPEESFSVNHWFGGWNFPRSIWVDRESKLIQRARVDHRELTFTYSTPEISTIYDIGVPHDAKINDTRLYRPTKDTLAIFNRVSARFPKEPPEGTIAMLTESGQHVLSMTVSSRSGKENRGREFKDVVMGGAPQQYPLVLPENWDTTGADEFFRRVSATDPSTESSGDGTLEGSHMRMFDERNGRYVSGGFVSRPTSPIFGGFFVTSPYFGITVMPSRFSAGGDHLDIATDKDRPGQIALHFQNRYEGPDTVLSESWLWLDPSHDDRPISLITLPARSETEFSDFVTRPVPDGHAYPTTAITTTYVSAPNGKLTVQSREKVSFRFFPGRSLPEMQLRER